MQHPELAAELAEVHPGVGLLRMRQKAGLSLRSVSRAAGCAPSTLSRIERRITHEPDNDLVWRVANAIGFLRGGPTA